MKIEFHLFDKTTNTFKKVYFKEWNGNGPIFTSNVNKSKKYWTEKQAEEDITIIYKATSPIARTLSIKLVP